MEPTDAELIAAVLQGDTASFEPLVKKYLPRVFATARRYARRDSEIEDIVQEVWRKAFLKLSTFRGDAPFEHWLMTLAVHTCYDFLRGHQRNRETTFTELSAAETGWLDQFVAKPDDASESAAAARQLVGRLLEMLSPPARLIITLLEIEEKSVKEIAKIVRRIGANATEDERRKIREYERRDRPMAALLKNGAAVDVSPPKTRDWSSTWLAAAK